ncbi:MAG: hypothetical protein ACTHN3_14955 [Solirubrobacterales bacterium]
MAERLRLRFVADDSRLREIAELYWSQDEEGQFEHRVGEIADAFDLTESEVREAVNAAAVAESVALQCSGCGSPRTFVSRHDVARSTAWARTYLCDLCRSKEAEEQAREQEEALSNKRKQIEEGYTVPEGPLVEVPRLGLEEAVALHALIRLCADESLQAIRPIATSARLLAPGNGYIYELLKDLAGEGTIYVDPTSSLEAFVWGESGDPDRYYLDAVAWRLPGPAGELKRVADELEAIFGTREWPKHWEDEAPHLQMLLAAHELSAYLVARYEEHHFQFSPAEKTWAVLDSMAAQLSIGQGYSLIWKAARDAAAFYVREGCEKRRATGWGIGALRRSFERAQAKGWTISNYNRPWSMEESEVTHLFYRVFLGAQDPITVAPPKQDPLPEADQSQPF